MSALVIDRLDADGAGVAQRPDGAPFAVPGALPGERWQLTDGARALVTPSPDRAVPPCDLFGACGSCAAQHMSDHLYAAWKVGLVGQAFAHVGLHDVPIAPLRRAPLASRRRITLTAKGSTVGYHAKGSHTLIDVAECLALDPALARQFAALRDLAQQLAEAGDVRLTATLVDNGIDVAATRERPQQPRRKANQRHKKKHPHAAPLLVPDEAFVRVTLDGDLLMQRDEPVVHLGGTPVPFPSGAFLQASNVGERHLTEAVLEALENAVHVADLFCGIGTFSLPLARRATVLGVESHAQALAALAAAASRSPGLKRIETLRRDLMRDPMAPNELAGVDAVVFDPPRAGALAQAQSLAQSTVPLVVAVSCNPRTLARDCAVLVGAGFKITQVVPVDQFVATAHIEVVAMLRRE